MKSVKGFTVLEIVTVMALTGVLVSILFAALNRFNGAMANEVKIKSELNSFFMLRSTIWKDLDAMDSLIVTEKKGFTIYSPEREIQYNIIDEGVERVTKNGSKRFDIPIQEVKLENTGKTERIRIVFDWKDNAVNLTYPILRSPNEQINQYFITQQWQKQ